MDDAVKSSNITASQLGASIGTHHDAIAIFKENVQRALQAKYLYREDLSRKGAKPQSATAFLRAFSAPSRLCARNILRPSMRLVTFRAKPALLLLCCLSTVSSAVAQEPIEDVVVTGRVRKVVLCIKEPYTWIYRFSITLQAKNTGTRPVIISRSQATVVYYKVAHRLDELSRGEYAHIGWVTSGPGKDPKSVPGRPVAPFKIVAPGRRVVIDVDFRAVWTRELRPGPIYIDVIAENWPHYSDNYVARLKQAWQPHGLLWAHSLHSQPISSILPSGLKVTRCP